MLRVPVEAPGAPWRVPGHHPSRAPHERAVRPSPLPAVRLWVSQGDPRDHFSEKSASPYANAPERKYPPCRGSTGGRKCPIRHTFRHTPRPNPLISLHILLDVASGRARQGRINRKGSPRALTLTCVPPHIFPPKVHPTVNQGTALSNHEVLQTVTIGCPQGPPKGSPIYSTGALCAFSQSTAP